MRINAIIGKMSKNTNAVIWALVSLVLVLAASMLILMRELIIGI
jgi:hypothetical protein